MASPLLIYLLRTALPALLRTTQGDCTKPKRQRQHAHPAAVPSMDAHAYVDSVLDRLLERALLPLLRALAPLCFARLASLVTAPSKKPSRPAGKGKGKDKDKQKEKEKDKDKGADATSVPPKTADTRTDVFALIGTSLEALDALPSPGPGGDRVGSIVVGIRDRLGLETIRELEALYGVASPPSASEPSSESQQPSVTLPGAPPPPTPLSAPSQPHSQPLPQPQARTQQCTAPESRAKRLERLAGTRAERVRALATKDAGWFLASTLNLCVTSAPAPTPMGSSGPSHGVPAAGTADHSNGLLRKALLDRVGKLVRTMPSGGYVSDNACDDHDHDRTNGNPKFAIDPVCQDMLLAICERSMVQLAPCSPRA